MGSSTVLPDAPREMLAARARRLAARGDAPVGAAGRRPLLLWRDGDELHGLPAEAVAAVLPWTTLTPLIGRETACLGLMGWRGGFYSVVDLGRSAQGKRDHILPLLGLRPRVALAVTRALGFIPCLPGSETGLARVAAEGPADLRDRSVTVFDQAALAQRLGLTTIPKEPAA